MQTIYKKPAQKTLRKMPMKLAQAIMSKVDALAAEGFAAHVDVKTLKGVEGGYRIRQGDWRVLLLKEGETLFVTDIKPRGDAYK